MPSPSTPRVVVQPVAGDRRWDDVELGHGESPDAAATRSVGHPVVVVALLSADVVEGALVLSLEVRRAAADDPVPAVAGSVAGVRTRRIGAYAVVLDAGRILLTQLARDTPAPGAWTLPGGGLDEGEPPLRGVLREVHEETAHELVATRLLDVDSTRFSGHAPSGRLEDFHGIGVIYAASVREVLKPRVLDVGGSTAAAAWVRLADLKDLPMAPRDSRRLARMLTLAQA